MASKMSLLKIPRHGKILNALKLKIPDEKVSWIFVYQHWMLFNSNDSGNIVIKWLLTVYKNMYARLKLVPTKL